MNKLVMGLPKGSLQEATFTIMRKAGFNLQLDQRSYVPMVDDPEIDARLIRAQEISRYVELGMLDIGITGYDWIMENGSQVVEVAELVYAKQGLHRVKWVVAVPESSPIQSVNDLRGKRIATEAVQLTRQFLERHGVEATVEFSWGATEVKTPELVDAIVELTETGTSLKAHSLRVVATVIESSVRLIANTSSWAEAWKRQKIEQVSLLLNGVLAAENKVLIKLNTRAENVDTITRILPALNAPTINALATEGWVAVESVVEEQVVRGLLPQLKAHGAEGIVELPLNKLIS